MEDDDWSGALASALHDANDKNLEDDGPSMDFMAGGGAVPGGKVPLEQWPSLVMIRKAAEDIRLDHITPEEFIEKVKKLEVMADNGIKLFEAEAVKKAIAKLPPDQMEVALELNRQMPTLKEGCVLMRGYIETQKIDDLDQGLALVEKSMANSEKVRERADHLNEEEEKAKAEAKEAEEAAKSG